MRNRRINIYEDMWIGTITKYEAYFAKISRIWAVEVSFDETAGVALLDWIIEVFEFLFSRGMFCIASKSNSFYRQAHHFSFSNHVLSFHDKFGPSLLSARSLGPFKGLLYFDLGM
jgi:hypothetical protein